MTNCLAPIRAAAVGYCHAAIVILDLTCLDHFDFITTRSLPDHVYTRRIIVPCIRPRRRKDDETSQWHLRIQLELICISPEVRLDQYSVLVQEKMVYTLHSSSQQIVRIIVPFSLPRPHLVSFRHNDLINRVYPEGAQPANRIDHRFLSFVEFDVTDI